MHMEKGWYEALEQEFSQPYMFRLQEFLIQEANSHKTVYPPEDLVFNAFCQTPYDRVKVVIIGQDPYHGKGQAEGLSFSVPKNITPPPSLKNIFNELHTDLGLPIPRHGSLLFWAKQGVLLLNATLTVREKEPNSHKGQGWEIFTDKVVEILSKKEDPIVFMLWGKSAQEKCLRILNTGNCRHLVLTTTHPSPYSASYGFFGCRHFSQANAFLEKNNKKQIDWSLP